MPQQAPEQQARPARPEWEYELRMPDGRLAGLHHVLELQGALYAGRLEKDCSIRRPAPGPAWPGDAATAGDWQPLWSVPALRRVLELQGVELQPSAGTERRIAGWQRSGDAAAEQEASASLPSVTMATPAVAPAPAPARSNLVPLIVGTVLLLLVLLVVGLVLAG